MFNLNEDNRIVMAQHPTDIQNNENQSLIEYSIKDVKKIKK